MAESEDFRLGTPQEHALMCKKHELIPIDITCEDCEEFICSKCVKEDHKDHDWDTITTAATLKRRGLLKSMIKTEEESIQQIDGKIQMACQQMDENKERCEIEILRLQNHFDAIVEKLDKIRKKHEETLRESLEKRNAAFNKIKSKMEEKKKTLLQCVKSIKENNSNMFDIVLLKVLRELKKLVSSEEDFIDTSLYSMRYQSGGINEAELESMMGRTFDVEQIRVTEIGSFQWNEYGIDVLEAFNDESVLLGHCSFSYLEQVNKSGEIKRDFSFNITDVCVTDNNDIYITDFDNYSVSHISLSNLVSTLFSTHPLKPMGICQTMDGDLLISLRDDEVDMDDIIQGHLVKRELTSNSRRLVRQVNLKGDIIQEYEYQDDGKTRLFKCPWNVTQNSNTDICVLNSANESTTELKIISSSGSLKSVYSSNKYTITDVVCDSHCNIIVNVSYDKVHLLSPEGKFMRCLLTEKQVNFLSAISLKKSTLWVGNLEGHVKVFQYKS